MKLLDETRRNLEVSFRSYLSDLSRKSAGEDIKEAQELFAKKLGLDESLWRKRQQYQDETARIDLSAITKTFANENAVAGFTRDDIPGLECGSYADQTGLLAPLNRGGVI